MHTIVKRKNPRQCKKKNEVGGELRKLGIFHIGMSEFHKTKKYVNNITIIFINNFKRGWYYKLTDENGVH